MNLINYSTSTNSVLLLVRVHFILTLSLWLFLSILHKRSHKNTHSQERQTVECVSLCVRVCVRERARESESEREKERCPILEADMPGGVASHLL